MLNRDLALTERNLILTGYREPNKPRLGRRVAERLRMPFLDVEARLEEAIENHPMIERETTSQRLLQTLEADVISEIILRRQTVIRIDGSTLTRQDHREKLLRTGYIVCLVARLDSILQQMHLALGARYHDPTTRAVEVGKLKAEWAIRGAKGVREVDLTGYRENEMVERLVQLWQEISVERS